MNHTIDSRQKISLGLKAAYSENRRTNRRPMLGKKHSLETKLKMREAAKQRILIRPDTIPDHTGRIKDNAGYGALHAWAKKHFGLKVECEQCGATDNLDWANLDGNYSRNRQDWAVLCRSCHMKYDRKNNIWKPERLKQCG